MFMVGILLRFGSVAAWIFKIVACMGGCVGSSLRPKLDSAGDEPLNLEVAPAAYEGNTSDSFWTSSNCEFDISTFQSQGSSISSIGAAMHEAGSSNASDEFVNHGLLQWNQDRRQWIGSRKRKHQAQRSRESSLSWNSTYESVLGNDKPFRKPVPLSEMVEFLVDIWEQEGMYN